MVAVVPRAGIPGSGRRAGNTGRACGDGVTAERGIYQSTSTVISRQRSTIRCESTREERAEVEIGTHP